MVKIMNGTLVYQSQNYLTLVIKIVNQYTAKYVIRSMLCLRPINQQYSKILSFSKMKSFLDF